MELEIESLEAHRPGSLVYIATSNEKISFLKEGRTKGRTPKAVLATSMYAVAHGCLHACIHTNYAYYLCKHTRINWGRMRVVHAHRKLWSLEGHSLASARATYLRKD